jgi:chlorobactene glucosyltransferase
MESTTFLILLSSLGLMIGLLITIWIHSSYQMEIVVHPTPHPARPDQSVPLISVIIPARNEARNIRRCVEALLSQDYPRLELIVVDDRSNDATPQILAEMATRFSNLQIIKGAEPPPDWAGKPFALTQGADQAMGDWLCFIDADTFCRPACLASALATANQYKADLFSILTDQELGSFWEKTILPLVFTALSIGFPAKRVNDPARPEAIANGQFILIRCAVYQAIGGHRSVHDQIAEDKALAERVKRLGHRLIIADGRAVAQTRMYTNLPEIWEGWTKNIFLGMRDRLGLLLAGAVIGLLGSLLLPFWLIAGVLWLATSGHPAAWVVSGQASLLWAILLWYRVRAARAFHIPAAYALTLPIGTLLFTAMMAASAYKVLSGQGVTWKGRNYLR